MDHARILVCSIQPVWKESHAHSGRLQNLLNESVVIKDMRTIVETLSDECAKTQDPEQLTSLVRPKLGRMIIQSIVDADSTLEVMTLEPELEQLLHNVIQQNQGNQEIVLEPGLQEGLFRSLRESTRCSEAGHPMDNGGHRLPSRILGRWFTATQRLPRGVSRPPACQCACDDWCFACWLFGRSSCFH